MLRQLFKKYCLLDPETSSMEEMNRWTWLRAVEWMTLPEYIAQLIAPILFIFFDVRVILLGLFLASFVWIVFIRSNFLFLPLSAIPVLFIVFLKWPVCLGVGLYFLLKHNYFLAVFSALWPIWMMLIMFIPDLIFIKFEINKYPIGIIQKKFAYLLGYNIDLNVLKAEQENFNQYKAGNF